MLHGDRRGDLQVASGHPRQPVDATEGVALVRPERLGTFFGLYALSGTATMWLGPLLVAVGTQLTQSQQGGFATVLILLGLGFLLLLGVKVPARG